MNKKSSSKNYTTAILIDDDTGEQIKPQTSTFKQLLLTRYNSSTSILHEIGVDEVGRGPLFGRVYCAAVVLPTGENCNFDHSQMKDSKRFHSVKKIKEIAEYIKQNALAWAVEYEDEKSIDKHNILNATQYAMHKAIDSIKDQLFIKKLVKKTDEMMILVDGNYFKPFQYVNTITQTIEKIPYETIIGGDNMYTNIAAASILAKVARDEYINELCDEHPYLDTNYKIRSNKGYGAKVHMDGIKLHGITQWHRQSFGPCKSGPKCLI